MLHARSTAEISRIGPAIPTQVEPGRARAIRPFRGAVILLDPDRRPHSVRWYESWRVSGSARRVFGSPDAPELLVSGHAYRRHRRVERDWSRHRQSLRSPDKRGLARRSSRGALEL